jgi:hypothetical protein
MQSTEVIETLQGIRDQVETHLRGVREYRAFLSIQVAMDEIAHVGELHSPLEAVREGVRQRLNDLREYRALLAVEKSITDIAGVLGLLDEIAPRPAPQAPVSEPAPANVVATEVAAKEEATSEEQPVVAQTQEQFIAAPSEPPPLPAEVFVVTSAPEAIATSEVIATSDVIAASQVMAAPAEVASAPAFTEVHANAPVPAFAENTPFYASEQQAADIIVPAEIAAAAPLPFETPAPGVDQDIDSLRLALGAAPVEANEPPAPLVVAESNPTNEPPGIGSEHVQEEPQQTAPEHDPAIAKVA